MMTLEELNDHVADAWRDRLSPVPAHEPLLIHLRHEATRVFLTSIGLPFGARQSTCSFADHLRLLVDGPHDNQRLLIFAEGEQHEQFGIDCDSGQIICLDYDKQKSFANSTIQQFLIYADLADKLVKSLREEIDYSSFSSEFDEDDVADNAVQQALSQEREMVSEAERQMAAIDAPALASEDTWWRFWLTDSGWGIM